LTTRIRNGRTPSATPTPVGPKSFSSDDDITKLLLLFTIKIRVRMLIDEPITLIESASIIPPLQPERVAA
jgi:hypothetical protein